MKNIFLLFLLLISFECYAVGQRSQSDKTHTKNSRFKYVELEDLELAEQQHNQRESSAPELIRPLLPKSKATKFTELKIDSRRGSDIIEKRSNFLNIHEKDLIEEFNFLHRELRYPSGLSIEELFELENLVVTFNSKIHISKIEIDYLIFSLEYVVDHRSQKKLYSFERVDENLCIYNLNKTFKSLVSKEKSKYFKRGRNHVENLYLKISVQYADIEILKWFYITIPIDVGNFYYPRIGL